MPPYRVALIHCLSPTDDLYRCIHRLFAKHSSKGYNGCLGIVSQLSYLVPKKSLARGSLGVGRSKSPMSSHLWFRLQLTYGT